MKEFSTTAATVVPAAMAECAWQEVGASFERFCLASGIATLAGMMEATKGFRRLKAHKQLHILRAAMAARHPRNEVDATFEPQANAA